jgi:hypothetical protein
MRRVAIAVAVCALLAGLAVRATAQSPVPEFVGAWTLNVEDFDNELICISSSLVHPDGGIAVNSCSANQSPGYGQWVRTGRREYAVTLFGVVYADNGKANRFYRVRATVVVGQDGVHFSGPSITDVFWFTGYTESARGGSLQGHRIFVEGL